MSGYDFLSGFFGTMSEEMRAKEQRKQQVEDEDRQYQRAMSREEAIAASRERLQRAAEERAMKRAEPKPFETVQNGKRMGGVGKWNPETQSYDAVGELSEIRPTVDRTLNVNGRVIEIMTDGTQVDRGESDTGLRTKGASARAAQSAAARIKAAEISSAGRSEKTPDISAAYRKALMPAIEKFSDPTKRKGIIAAYNLSDNATVEDLKTAVRAAVDPNYKPPQKEQSMFDVLGAGVKSLVSGKGDHKLAEKIAAVKSSDPDAANASDEEIIQYLIDSGQIK